MWTGRSWGRQPGESLKLKLKLKLHQFQSGAEPETETRPISERRWAEPETGKTKVHWSFLFQLRFQVQSEVTLPWGLYGY